MRTRAAIFWGPGKEWSVEEIVLDDPKPEEVLVRIAASGMCHSDEHLVSGDVLLPPPIIGGHEAAGVVERVGEGVTSVKPGDEIIFSYVPTCGRCASCASGHSNRCDRGAKTPLGWQISDDTARHHTLDGQDLALFCNLGAFAEHTVVNEDSCVKIEHENISLASASLLGCAVVTGWGSAVYAGDVGPGDDVAVIGVGGVGINAVQGAKAAGAGRIFAIDPVEFKRTKALEFGATHAYASIEEATELIREDTWGRMCNQVILTMGVGDPDMVGKAMDITAKRGRVVVTNIHASADDRVSIRPQALTTLERQLVGSLYGSGNPRYDIPRLLRLYLEGQLKLDELVTQTYTLDQINLGYEDMRAGRNLRGVITF